MLPSIYDIRNRMAAGANLLDRAMNWMVIPTLLLTFILFAVGTWIWRRLRTPAAKIGIFAAAIVAALPGVMFAISYFHVFENIAWFYELRAAPLSELMAAGTGLLAAILGTGRGILSRMARPVILATLTIGILVPYLKPVLWPLPENRFHDQWANGVCLQSTAASCGPASAATLLRASGQFATERQVARECYTYNGGTEAWYLARYFRRHGYTVRFVINPADRIPVPSIAGVRVGGTGHFIPVLAETATSYITGDPTCGKQEWPKDKLRTHFDFTGFFMAVDKADRIKISHN